MIKMTINRLKRTMADAMFHVAPIWHLTNLRREAYDQLEELHYQVGFCRANRNQLIERLEEIEQSLLDPQLDPESKLTLQSEKRQLEARLRETEEMEDKAHEVVASYQSALPKLVSQLDLAIQMARQTRSQRATLKMLGSSGAADGSEINEHIKQVRSKAYALSQQLDGHLAANKMKRTKLLMSK
ncbi:MAG: hypothetical protein IT541_09600 [Hyphomicrobiales bacterium]|jgi:Spy/CpxP family protein refolding chaperone|nr:hypothetical protein [Hyphomicrobiales bacterium]